MTKDRALRVLDVYASVNGSGQCTQDEFEEAKKMAIEALESQDRQVIIAGSYLLEGEDNVPDTNVGDIISRQAAIEALSTPHGILYPIRTIESLPSAQPEQRWIPCSERMPESLQEVLVTSTHGHVYTSRIVHGDFEYGGNVLAWMPLPEPWKEKPNEIH